ncbi:MAG: F0F1 ATP synthase subunit A [Omnitrophica WOR_2 bacterium]
MEQTRKWRYGVNRWIILVLIILGVFAVRSYPPILPHIQLPAEPLFTVFAGFEWTNTMTAMVIADIIILLLAFGMRRALTSGKLLLNGFWNAFEALLELIYNLTDSTAGRWAKSIFPFFATITLYVLIVNWMELIPGVDSVGKMEYLQSPPASVTTYPTQILGMLGNLKIETIIKGKAAAEGAVVVPFVRVLSTDLNFTVALALIAVTFVQVFGIRAKGSHYFIKFFNVGGIFKRPVFGLIDFAVSLLELVSEFSKILSFSFRLFGNIFAGSVLLFVIGTLVPVLAQSGFLLLEFFVGLIQAVVFGMLAMIFMSQATQGHENPDVEASS